MANWRESVRRVVPYTPGEQPKGTSVIKLNTNENPYPPSPRATAFLAEDAGALLRRYPDPSAAELTEAVAAAMGVEAEQVFTGVGSDDVLAMAFLTFFNSKDPLLFPDITYSFYDVWAELFGIPYEKIPLDEEFCIRPEDYRRTCGGIIFPNPNAPTGRLLPLETIREILDHKREQVVIVDEAYIDFGGQSAVPLISEYDNLLVVQTFSKSRSAAGLRIGYALGSPELIRCMQDVKFSFNSYTMNAWQIRAGAAILSDEEYFRSCCQKIIATRETSVRRLRELGFSVLPSAANFVFAKHERAGGRELFEYLRSREIYVRYWDRPRIGDYLRITIGTDEEMESLFEALKEYLCRS